MIAMKPAKSTIEHCLEDRNNVGMLGHDSLARACGFDLLAKILVLYCNSIGLRTEQKALFVDEINNPSARNNLQRTAHLTMNGEETYLRFYSFKRKQHCRTGIIWTIIHIILAVLKIMPTLGINAAKSRILDQKLAKHFAGEMVAYLNRCGNTNLYILMTDHHFYSTVIAESCSDSIVLQHGLIQDIRFFSPVRASAICCWSKKSADIIGSSKALVTGTYKFQKVDAFKAFAAIPSESDRVLVCLSSSKTVDEIRRRLGPVCGLAKRYGFHIAVKMHPGSLFSLNELKDFAEVESIEFYKDERIEEISFDFAIIEQSTAVIDIACLGIPFIVCSENRDMYFAEYDKVLPIAYSETELIEQFESFSYSNWKNAVNVLLEREVNDCKSTLRELILGRIVKS